jgi:hypothetical protein
MSRLTRRGFLTRISIGAATTGVLGGALVAAPRMGSLPHVENEVPPASAASRSSALQETEPLVVHVRNLAAGEVSVLVGTHEVSYRDPVLVAHLSEIAAGQIH